MSLFDFQEEYRRSFMNPSGGLPTPTRGGWYNPAEGRLAFGGVSFPEEDVSSIWRYRPELEGRPMADPGAGWQPVSEQGMADFMERIAPDQGVGQAASEGVRRGANVLQSMAGSALQLFGMESWGGAIREDAERALANRDIYAQKLENIDGVGDVPQYVVGLLSEQAPMLAATAVTGGSGYLAGGLARVAGSRVAAGAADRLSPVMKWLGNEKNVAAMQGAARKKLAGEALDEAESAALATGIKSTGALLGVGLSSYGMGIGDVYGELRDAGADEGDLSSRALAFVAGIPYAAMDLAAEGVVARSVLKPILQAPAGRRGRAVLGAMGRGAGAAGLAGAAGEAGQEGVVMGTRALETGEAFEPGENPWMRVANAASAGFTAGAALGGAGRGYAQYRQGEAPAPPPGEPTGSPAGPMFEPTPAAPDAGVVDLETFEPTPAAPDAGVVELDPELQGRWAQVAKLAAAQLDEAEPAATEAAPKQPMFQMPEDPDYTFTKVTKKGERLYRRDARGRDVLVRGRDGKPLPPLEEPSVQEPDWRAEGGVRVPPKPPAESIATTRVPKPKAPEPEIPKVETEAVEEPRPAAPAPPVEEPATEPPTPEQALFIDDLVEDRPAAEEAKAPEPEPEKPPAPAKEARPLAKAKLTGLAAKMQAMKEAKAKKPVVRHARDVEGTTRPARGDPDAPLDAEQVDDFLSRVRDMAKEGEGRLSPAAQASVRRSAEERRLATLVRGQPTKVELDEAVKDLEDREDLSAQEHTFLEISRKRARGEALSDEDQVFLRSFESGIAREDETQYTNDEAAEYGRNLAEMAVAAWEAGYTPDEVREVFAPFAEELEVDTIRRHMRGWLGDAQRHFGAAAAEDKIVDFGGSIQRWMPDADSPAGRAERMRFERGRLEQGTRDEERRVATEARRKVNERLVPAFESAYRKAVQSGEAAKPTATREQDPKAWELYDRARKVLQSFILWRIGDQPVLDPANTTILSEQAARFKRKKSYPMDKRLPPDVARFAEARGDLTAEEVASFKERVDEAPDDAYLDAITDVDAMLEARAPEPVRAAWSKFMEDPRPSRFPERVEKWLIENKTPVDETFRMGEEAAWKDAAKDAREEAAWSMLPTEEQARWREAVQAGKQPSIADFVREVEADGPREAIVAFLSEGRPLSQSPDLMTQDKGDKGDPRGLYPGALQPTPDDFTDERAPIPGMAREKGAALVKEWNENRGSMPDFDHVPVEIRDAWAKREKGQTPEDVVRSPAVLKQLSPEQSWDLLRGEGVVELRPHRDKEGTTLRARPGRGVPSLRALRSEDPYFAAAWQSEVELAIRTGQPVIPPAELVADRLPDSLAHQTDEQMYNELYARAQDEAAISGEDPAKGIDRARDTFAAVQAASSITGDGTSGEAILGSEANRSKPENAWRFATEIGGEAGRTAKQKERIAIYERHGAAVPAPEVVELTPEQRKQGTKPIKGRPLMTAERRAALEADVQASVLRNALATPEAKDMGLVAADLAWEGGKLVVEPSGIKKIAEWAGRKGSHIETDVDRPTINEVMGAAHKLAARHNRFPKTDGSGTLTQGARGPEFFRKGEAVAKAFSAKMRAAPRIVVTRNAETLAARFPKVAEALGESMDAVRRSRSKGLYFDGQVVLFTDHVQTEGEIETTLLHEALGHHGLRAILDERQLAHVLAVAREDPSIAAEAERREESMREAGETYDLNEMVEEILADRAADPEGIVQHVWKRIVHAIKSALSRLGVRFADEADRMADYWLWQARRYVRTGEAPGPRIMARFDIDAGMDRKAAMAGAVRHSRNMDQPYDPGSLFRTAGDINTRLPGFSDRMKDKWDAWASKEGVPAEGSRVWDAVTRLWQSSNQKAQRSAGIQQIYDLDSTRHTESQKVLRGGAQYATTLLSGKSLPDENAYTRFAFAAALNRAGDAKTSESVRTGSSPVQRKGMEFAVNEAALTEAARFGAFGQDLADTRPNAPDGSYERVEAAIAEVQARAKSGVTWTDERGTEHTFTEDLSHDAARMVVEQRAYTKYMVEARLKAEVKAANNEQRAIVNDLVQGASDKAKARAALGRLLTWRAKTTLKSRGPAGRHQTPSPVVGQEREEADLLYNRVLRALHGRSKDDAAVKLVEELDLGALDQMGEGEVRSSVAKLMRQEIRMRVEGRRAQQTLAGAFLHFARRGDQAVITEAVDKTGRRVELDEAWKAAMPVFGEPNRMRANQTARELAQALEGVGTIKVTDAAGKEVEVTLRTRVFSKAKQHASAGRGASFGAMLSMLDNANVEISAEDRERLVQMFERESSMKGAMLQRMGNPGWDKDAARSLSEWGEKQAYAVGRADHEQSVARLLADDEVWRGSQGRLARLEKAVEAAPDEAARFEARQAADRYFRQMLYSHSGEFTYGGRTYQGKGRADEYRDHARKMHAQLVESGTGAQVEGLLDEGVGGMAMMGTALAQLGMSPATAALNWTAPWMTGLPYLAFYNAKRGWGGGYGLSDSAATLSLAFRKMGSPAHRLHEPESFEGPAGEALRKKLGVSKPVWSLLHDATAGGVLQASESLAVMGVARGKLRSAKARAVVDGWMWFFNFTEQHARRAMFLTGAELEAKRWVAAGHSLDAPSDAMKEAMRKAGTAAVTESLGDYAHHNRGVLSRHPLLMYPMMYKHFVITTIQAMHNMDAKGRAMFLGSVMLLGGLKELPYAQDLMDAGETIARAFGMKGRTWEHAVSELLDTAIPGSGKIFLNGFANSMLGATISTRTGFGNIVPGTAAFLPGHSTGREMEEVAGAFYSAWSGAFSTAGELGHQGLEAVGLLPETRSWRYATHDMPVTILRNIMHSFMIGVDGRVTDRRGNVVEEDAPNKWILYRMLGFSPWKTTHARNMVQWQRALEEDARSTRSGLVNAAVDAMIRGDRDAERTVYEAVREHNMDVRRARLPQIYQIRNFRDGVRRSYRISKEPLLARSVERARRSDRGYFRDLYGLEG